MKKFLILLLLFLSMLCIPYYNNDYVDITHMINISSIGLEYTNDTYNIYAYVINNYTMSKSDLNTSSDSSIATIITSNGNSIEKAFFNLYDSVFVKLNFSHIETLVLHTSFISQTNFNMLIDFISKHNDFYPKFNVYITENKIKDIFNINYFTDTSSYYNILTEYQSEIEHHTTTFIDLINDFLEPNYFILYPSLNINYNIIRTDKLDTSLFIDGYYYMDNEVLSKITYESTPLLYLLYSTNDISLNINNNNYFLYSYSLKTIKINNKLYILFYSKSNYQNSLKDLVKLNIETLYKNNIDVYNLNYLNIKIDDVIIISVEKNTKKSL